MPPQPQYETSGDGGHNRKQGRPLTLSGRPRGPPWTWRTARRLVQMSSTMVTSEMPTMSRSMLISMTSQSLSNHSAISMSITVSSRGRIPAEVGAQHEAANAWFGKGCPNFPAETKSSLTLTCRR